MEIHQQSWSKDFHFLDQSQTRNLQGEWLDMEKSGGGKGTRKQGLTLSNGGGFLFVCFKGFLWLLCENRLENCS